MGKRLCILEVLLNDLVNLDNYLTSMNFNNKIYVQIVEFKLYYTPADKTLILPKTIEKKFTTN